MNPILATLSYLRKLALCFWIGEMLFFIVIFAPRVFRVLPRENAAELQAAIFPAYYNAGIVCALVVLLSLMATQTFGVRSLDSYGSVSGELFTSPPTGSRQLSQRRFRTVIGLTLLAGIVFLVSRTWITPELTALQPLLYGETASAESQESFRFLHKLSVQMNGAALLALLVLLFLD